MNEKEKVNLKYYKDIIEKRKFTEYDIIGFLVLIREYIDKSTNPIFHDFADGTAHRKRNKGIIYDCMYNAELACYKFDEEGNIADCKRDEYGRPILFVTTSTGKVGGYHGLSYDAWLKECHSISEQFNIRITPIIAKELLVCMFSIIHRAIIKTDSRSIKKKVKINGSVEMMSGPGNSLSLLTSDDNKKFTVCFMKIENMTVFKSDFIMDGVDTFRKGGILYLRENNDIILKVSCSRKSN